MIGSRDGLADLLPTISAVHADIFAVASSPANSCSAMQKDRAACASTRLRHRNVNSDGGRLGEVRGGSPD